MKTGIIIPAILAISLRSFMPAVSPKQIRTQTINAPVEYCSIYGVASLSRNGQPVQTDPGTLFYFCSEGMFSLYTHNYTAQGSWLDTGKDLVISVAAPDPSMDWVDGNWQVLERSDWTLEMEQVENGDVWRVRLEGRQR
jgi:hypothetical protein